MSKYCHTRVLKLVSPQLIRYVLVGVTLNAGSYIAYLLLTWQLFESEAAMTITFSIGTILSFLANRRVTFRHQGNQLSALIRFVTAYALLYIVNFMALWIFARQLRAPHQVVQACVILVLTLLAFLTQKFWVFPATTNSDDKRAARIVR